MINEHYDYVTKSGDYRVKFYNMNSGSIFPVHGAIFIEGFWVLMAWSETGKADPVYSMTEPNETCWDLKRVRYSPKKEKAVVIVSNYPTPLPQRILKTFNGKRVRVTLEEC